MAQQLAPLAGREDSLLGAEILRVVGVQVGTAVDRAVPRHVESIAGRGPVVEAEVGAPLGIAAPALGQVDRRPVAAQEGPVQR